MARNAWEENIRQIGVPQDDAEESSPRQQPPQRYAPEQQEGVAATGRDPSGVVRADVDEYRQLLRLVVASGWEKKIPAEGLAPAFRAAYQDAISKLPEIELPKVPAFTNAELERRVREYDGPPRSGGAFADSVLTAVEAVEVFLRDFVEQPQPVLPTPEDDQPRTIRLGALGGFLADCQVNALWARGRTGAEISNEAYKAIQQAREADHERSDPTAAALAQAQALSDKLMGFAYEGIARLRNY